MAQYTQSTDGHVYKNALYRAKEFFSDITDQHATSTMLISTTGQGISVIEV